MSSDIGVDGAAPSAELVERRAAIEQGLGSQPIELNVTSEWIARDDFTAVRVVPADPRFDCALLHFYGGGFRLGSAIGWLPFASRLAAATGRECVLVDYPLAPEHPFPTALNHAEAAYRWLAELGTPIVLAGDSAGGGLTASLALTVAEKSYGGHVGTILYSPWLELRVVNESYEANAAHDQQFTREAASEAASLYAAGVESDHPLVSPVLGAWSGQRPALLETSTVEVLRDDARHLARVLLQESVRLWYREVPDQPHDWPIAYPHSQAGLDTFELTSRFLDSLTG